MKKLKQTLALALVVCMLFSCLPVGALASENTSVDADVPESTEAVIQATSELTPVEPNRPEDGSTQNQPFPRGTGGSTYFRIPALTVLSDGTLVAAADARWTQYMDKGNIDTIVSVSEDGGANWNYTFANYIDDGGNTFNISAATFIDPAMAVKTIDGVETIFMVADLFPGQKSGDAMCIHAANYGTGMSNDGHLLVSDKNDNTLSDFNYYVGDYTDGVAPLCNSDGTTTDYVVDEWFNVYKGSTHLGNLFTYGDVYDSETGKTFYVYQTCYLVLTKSTDGGKTWSAPTMLNHQVKNASEKFYGVGPASGFVTSTGRIMFTAYTYTSADGNSSVFYSDDNGVTWTRAASVADQTSEAALTEVNGTIYMFTRYGNYYYYSTDNGTTWSGAQSTSGISYLKSCEVSVMTYSRMIDGKPAVLLSAPTSDNRYGGKIFVGLVNDDHSITWKYSYAVNTTSDRYQYSSLKELNDGSLGLLYENGDASIVYKNIAIRDVIGEDAVIGTPEKTINLTVGETKEFTLDEVVDSGSHTSNAADITWTKVDTTVSVPAAQLGSDISYSGNTIDLNDCLYTFTKNADGTWLISADVNDTTVYVDPYVYNNAGYPNRSYETNVTLSEGDNNTVNFKDNTADSTGRTGYLHFWDNSSTNLYWDNCTGNSCTGHDLLVYKVTDTSSTTVLGGYFEQVTLDKLVSGEKYLIVGHTTSGYDSNGYYAMHPSTSTSNKWSHVAKITGAFTDVTTSETTVMINANAVGSTSVQIGSMIYNVNVTPAVENIVDIELTAGTTEKVTLPENVASGSHTSDAADVTWGAEETTVSTPAAQLGSDISYSGNTIDLNDCLYTFTKNADGTWLISAEVNGTTVYVDPYVPSNGGYPNRSYTTNVTLTNGNNGAVVFGDGTGYLHFWDNSSDYLYWDNCTGTRCTGHHLLIYKVDDTSSSTVLGGYFKQVTLDKLVSGEKYLIVGHTTSGYDSNGYYAMHPSSPTSDKWSHLAKITGDFTTTTTSQNVMTINAKAAGTTSVVIGTTQYNIKVVPDAATVTETVDVVLTVDQSKTYNDTTGNHENNIPKKPDTSIATAEITGTNTTSEKSLSNNVTAIETGKTYVLYNKVAQKLMNNQWADASVGGGGSDGLALSSFKANFQDNDCWTVTVVDGGYYVRDINGKYLSIARGKAVVKDEPVVISLAFDGTDWTIGENGEYANDFGGSHTAVAGWSDINDVNSQWEIYEVITTVTASTEITFTGVTPGTTTAIVGTTLYNITVIDPSDCVTSENSPFVVGGDSIGSVTNDPKNKGMDYLTKLTMSSVMTKENLARTNSDGYQIDLSSAFANAERISWSIADESIAKIKVGEDGKSVYVTAADANTTGTTYLSCTIDGQTYTIPVVIMKTTEATSNWKYNSLHIAEITRTDVWYSWNNSGDADKFVKAIEGEAIWTVYAQSGEYFSISFYGAPDPDHALTYMSATNSDGEYHTLADKDDPTNCDYYTKHGSGYDQRNGAHFTNDQVANDIRAALGLGCDGAQGFYRDAGSSSSVNCNLTFISDPVPVIDKTVDGVLPTTRKQANYRHYAENMVASVNEQVYFKITVTLDAPTQWIPYDKDEHEHFVEIDGVKYVADENGNRYSAIVYSDAMVTDYALGTEHAFIYTKDIDNEDGKWDGEIPVENRRQNENVTDDLNAAWTEEELAAGKREIPLYLVYTIQEEDIPKFEITNSANLNFGFKSHYSTGVTAREAAADAKISVVGTAIDSVVIDFAQKITYSANSFVSISDGKEYTFSGLTNIHLKGAYVDGETIGNVTGSKALAKYGTATVTREPLLDENNNPILDGKGEPNYLYTVTYTPTSILQSVDTIQIYGIGAEGQEKLINSILVYPATTVYYEEGFLENVNNGWSFEKDAKKATTDQTFELLGLSQYNSDGELTHFVSGKRYAYGFDPIYDGIEDNGEVEASSISTATPGAAAKFTFTGTGFEIFANCTVDSGYVLVTVTDKNGNNVKMFTVNTVVKGGTTGATTGQNGNMDALPIVSLKDLEHGTYTVTLTKVLEDNKTVTIDGVRIFNIVADSSVYAIDLEDNPEFYEMRDSVMNAINIQNYLGESMYVDELTAGAKQVLAGISTDSEAPVALLSSVGNIYTGTADEKAPQDLLDNGPKNELYLWPGQTLTFNVRTNRTMQVGLKAPSGATVVSGTAVGSNPDDDMNTPIYYAVYGKTDMFYDLVTRPVADTENVYTVTITNMGENILSITDLKICDDPSAAFVPLTLDDVTEILRAAGYTDGSEPDVPNEPLPFEDVPADSFYYDSVAWAVKKGITNGVSETHFGPNAECNRAQAVTFLWRAAGSPEPTATAHGFVDVAAGSYYEKAVLWAVEKGITNGTDSTHFSPNQACSRSQVVTFLYRAFKNPVVENVENPFSDVPADAWYTAPVLWAVENGITNGTSSDLFDVNGVCNRAQIVTFLYRAYN